MREPPSLSPPPPFVYNGDVCAELRRSGGSGPDCRNPEVVVAITGRVLHNAPGCSKSCGEEGGGGTEKWEDPAETAPRATTTRGDRSRVSTEVPRHPSPVLRETL